MMDLDRRRRFFAEELEAVMKLRSAALVDAFAAVPREQFLRPGPWTVLADVDFELQHGEAVGIVGSNGAGKSTLLRILSRVTRPTTGRAQLRGRHRSGRAVSRRP